MDDYERELTRIETEDVIPAEPVAAVPVATTGQSVAATPVTPVAPGTPVTPVAAAAAAPVAAVPVASRVTTERTYTTTRPTGLELLRRVIAFAFGILQALLILRIILLLLVANPANDIVKFILNVTEPFVAPFTDMFALDKITSDSTGSILDIAAIVALIAWTLVEMLLLAIVNLFSSRRRVVES